MNSKAYQILWSTIEDYAGLWELEWELKSLKKDTNSKEIRNDLRTILNSFIANKLVDVYSNYWGSDKHELLSVDEVSKVILDDRFYEPPGINEYCIKIGSTPKGEQLYNEQANC